MVSFILAKINKKKKKKNDDSDERKNQFLVTEVVHLC